MKSSFYEWNFDCKLIQQIEQQVREDHIDPLVEATIKKNVDEDDLFRSLYRKYHLDESGEPIEDSVSSDWDASSDEDIDESQLSPEELQKVHARRERKENYQRQKREEAQHKAAAKQVCPFYFFLFFFLTTK